MDYVKYNIRLHNSNMFISLNFIYLTFARDSALESKFYFSDWIL